jgi:hypothetical protein
MAFKDREDHLNRGTPRFRSAQGLPLCFDRREKVLCRQHMPDN